MTNVRLADQEKRLTGEQISLTRATVLKCFAGIVVISFLLRIAYAGHLYEDDGLWFTAAEEILRGKALYREIYFDKPPGLPLVYAALFWMFGAHIITIRLFTIAYSIAISAVLYLFGTRLYGKRVGLLSAAMFAIFSTTYATGHTQGLNTEFLMVLPYTAAAYLMIQSRWQQRPRALLALAGGALAGVAFQFNPKGAFDLIFFAILLIASRGWGAAPIEPERNSTAGAERRFTSQTSLRLFFLAIAGVAAGSLPFLAYVAVTRSTHAYWSFVWDWGARYGTYYGTGKIALSALIRSADYFAMNNTLLIAFGLFAAAMFRRRFARAVEPRKPAPGASFEAVARFRPDAVLLIWFVVSYAGVMVGGRFFAHYFFQILPSLCLIGARGLTEIPSSLRRRSPAFRRGVIAFIALAFAFTLVRFHARGALLTADFVRGATSPSNAGWYYNLRGREERMVAASVTDWPEGADGVDRVGLEGFREGGPRTRPADGPPDFVFVWGYRPEIYYWSGLLPASRYLSTQPLTGVPADVHYFGDDYRILLDEAATAEARAQLVRDLEENEPKYIVDEIGFFNSHLALLNYPELAEFMREYKPLGTTGRFFLYLRKESSKKYRLRRGMEQQ